MRDYNFELDKVPKLMFTILDGGKSNGSKIKFSKFYLIIDMQPGDSKQFNIIDIYYKLNSKIEEGIKATKVGLAGFKKGSSDGACFNAFDNINECFKLIEDAITAVGINTDETKYLKIGINADAQNWFVEEGAKYDWDGPKNLLDSDQVIDFYTKICTDHPLLEFIEDPFANKEIKAFKKFCEKLKETNPNVKVSIKELFESSLEVTKEYTQFITPESDDEEETVEEEAKPEGDEEAPPEDAPVVEEKVDAKASKLSKASKKGKASEEVLEEEVGPPDINALKFIPGIIHLKKELQPNSSGVQQIANYSFTMKADDAFGLIIEDN